MLQPTVKAVAITLLSLPALTGASNSAALGIQCDYCSAAKVERLVQQAGPGEHEVFNFAEGTVQVYSVDNEADPVSVVELPPSVAVLQAAAGFKELFDRSGKAMTASATVNASNLGLPFASATAFTTIQNANLRAQLGDRLSDPTRPLTDLGANLNAARVVAARVIASAAPTLALTVAYQDGTSVKFEVDLTAGIADFVDGSGRTADGQLIPETAAQSDAGTWTGDVDDLVLIGQHMQKRGASFAFGQCRVGVDSHLRCAWDEAKSELACEIVRPCGQVTTCPGDSDACR